MTDAGATPPQQNGPKNISSQQGVAPPRMAAPQVQVSEGEGAESSTMRAGMELHDTACMGAAMNTVSIPWTEFMKFKELENASRKCGLPVAQGRSSLAESVMQSAELNSLDLKSMQRVQGMPLPEGAKWSGSGSNEKRSINRFLFGVMQVQRLGALDARTTFFYLTSRCMDERLSMEICGKCPSLGMVPPDYISAIREAEEYLRVRFARTNRTDKFTERVESNEWCKDIGSMEEYMQSFEFLMTEGSLLGLVYDGLQRRRIYLNGLPAELKRKAYDMLGWVPESNLAVLHDRLQEWMDLTGGSFFSKKKFQSAPTGVRAVGCAEGQLQEEKLAQATCAVATSANSRGAPGAGKGCFKCGEPGHFKRDCPQRNQPIGEKAAAAGRAPGRLVECKPASQDQGGPAVQAGPPTAGAVDGGKEVTWSCTVLAAAAGTMGGKVAGDVVISSPNGEGASCQVKALFDTGADVSMITRKFVNELFRQGVVTQANAFPGQAPDLLLADGSPMGKPLGLIEVKVEGHSAKLVVVESLCCSLIVGKDLMQSTSSDVFVLKLVAALRGCSAAEAKQLVAAAVTPAAPRTGPGQEQAARKAHCDFEPIVFKWKQGAKESLRCNLKAAMAESRQKERRMEPKLLESYAEILQTWEREGWLVEIPLRDAKFFLRHFAVVRDPNGATAMKRCRVVVEGSSLTELLEVPPCSHTDLLRNLVLWRTAERFACLDISQAYMRVGISAEDSLFMCIAWRGRALAFKSLPMGVSPSAQALQLIVDSYLVDWDVQATQEASGCVTRVAPYMDDLTLLLWRDGKGKGEVDLEKIEGDLSNKLAQFFTQRGLDIAAEKTVGSLGTGTLLGVPFADGMLGVAPGRLKAFSMEDFAKEQPTRRRACSLLASVYDPLGLIAEIGVGARLLASRYTGIAWNGLLPRAQAAELRRWIELALRALKETRHTQPRWLVPVDGNKVFVFSDASSLGYGVVVVAADERGVLRRFMAKGRLYQKHQKQWVGNSPKIELLGLKLAAETVQYLKKVFEGVPGWGRARYIIGTDSEANFQRFAQGGDALLAVQDRWQRLTAIEVNNVFAKNGCSVYHVAGPCNPADPISRGTWQGDGRNLLVAGVNWFEEERAVQPVRYLGSVDAEADDGMSVCSKSDAEDMATVDSHAKQGDWPAVAAVKERSGPTVVFAAQETLAERYAREADGLTMQEWMQYHQAQDPALMDLLKEQRAKLQNGVYVFAFRQELNGTPLFPVIVPPSLRENALATIHSQGHFGARKCIARARDAFWWKGLARDVKNHCVKCAVCQQIKGIQVWKTATGAPGLLKVEGRSWATVGVDTVKAPGGIILTATCLYSRFVFATAVKDEKAATLANALGRWFTQEGAPSLVVTDNGTYFRSSEFQGMLAKWGVIGRFSPRYSPFWGGFFEISHKALMAVLASLVLEQAVSKWKTRLQEAVLYYNLRCFENCDGVALSPFEVFRGRKLRNPWNRAAIESDELWPSDEMVKEATAEIAAERAKIGELYEEAWKMARTATMSEMQRKIKRAESYAVGEYVYVWLPVEVREGKLAPKWEGPFRVDRVLGPTRYQVGDRVEHAVNLKRAHVTVNPGGRNAVSDAPDPQDRYSQDGDRNGAQKASETSSSRIAAGGEKRKAEPDRFSDTLEEGESAEQGKDGDGPQRVQPPRKAKIKKLRLAVVLLSRPKGDLLWL